MRKTKILIITMLLFATTTSFAHFNFCSRTWQIRVHVCHILHKHCSEVIPEDLKQIHHIVVAGKGIYKLKKQDLRGFVNLDTLNLGYNRILALRRDDFKDLVSLRTLFLHWNNIPSLPRGIFRNLSNLEYLDLENNKIKSLQRGDFINLTKLKELHLGDNIIQSIEPGDFQGLSNLQLLDLSDNQLTSFEDKNFIDLPLSTVTIKLWGNDIDTSTKFRFFGEFKKQFTN